MHKRKMTLVGCAMAAVTGGLGPAAWPAPATDTRPPVAFTVRVPGGMVTASDVTVYAAADLGHQDPATAVLRVALPAARVSVAGEQVTVRLRPTDVPAGYRDRQLVNFEVFIASATAPRHGFGEVPARWVATAQGAIRWVDPIQFSDPVSAWARSHAADAPVRHARVALTSPGAICASDRSCARQEARFARQAHPPMDLRTLSRAHPAPGATAAARSASGCEDIHYWYTAPVRSTLRKATIGTSYPVDGDLGRMTFDSSSTANFTATLGGAVRESVGFKEVSGKTFSGGWSFSWDPFPAARSYQIDAIYTLYRHFYGCSMDPTWAWWRPVKLTGTTGERRYIPRPSFKGCRLQRSAGIWERYWASGRSYSLSYGVKFKDLIGIDLGSERAYNRRSILRYRLYKRYKWLCGNNDEPSLASKVGEYYRKQGT